MTLAEEPAQLLQLAALQRLDRVAHSLVLRLDVPDPGRDSGRDLALPFGVAGVLERVPLAGVDDENGEPVRERDVSVLERAAVEPEGRACAPEQRRRLNHDSARNSARAPHGSAARGRGAGE